MTEAITQLLGEQPADPNGRKYVLACEYDAKTYKLGLVQRSLIRYLRTAPAGFDGSAIWTAEGVLEVHGPPYGVTVRDLACTVYHTSEPTPNHIRTVQRNARRLQDLGLVDCWHGEVGTRESAYTTTLHNRAPMPVSGLYVALRWRCAHLVGAS